MSLLRLRFPPFACAQEVRRKVQHKGRASLVALRLFTQVRLLPELFCGVGCVPGTFLMSSLAWKNHAGVVVKSAVSDYV